MTDSEPVKSFEPEHTWVADAPIDDGWIEWKGGECPVEIGTPIDLKFRDGALWLNDIASYLDWRHMGDSRDIIAYRVVKP